MKNKIGLFIAGCFALILTSCLGDDEDAVGAQLYKNCQISSFTLTHSKIPSLANTKFTIDQMNGLIFNIDSLPYGTVLNKAICNVSYISESAVSGMNVKQTAIGDTIQWEGSDSLDFSKPVIMEVVAYDGITTKTYTAHVNIHTVVPDTMIWSLQTNRIHGLRMKDQKVLANIPGNEELFSMYVKTYDETGGLKLYQSSSNDVSSWKEASFTKLPANTVLQQITSYKNIYYAHTEDGDLYTSKNALNWEKINNTPTLKTILGVIGDTDKQDSGLAAIVNNNGTLTFAIMNKQGIWSTGDIVPDMFPISGFGATDFDAMYHNYLMVVAGKDKNDQLLNNSWATLDGKNWVMLTNDGSNYFTKREGVSLTKYDGKYYMIGGLLADGKSSTEIYTSEDRGVTWKLAEAKMVFPDNFIGRGYSSVVVDEKQYIYLFSGKTTTDGNQMNDVWRGRINRLGFVK